MKVRRACPIGRRAGYCDEQRASEFCKAGIIPVISAAADFNSRRA